MHLDGRRQNGDIRQVWANSVLCSPSSKYFVHPITHFCSHANSYQLLRQHYTAQYPDDAARSRYPTLMLKVTVLPSSVDVNLTPDKTQVLLHEKVLPNSTCLYSNTSCLPCVKTCLPHCLKNLGGCADSYRGITCFSVWIPAY